MIRRYSRPLLFLTLSVFITAPVGAQTTDAPDLFSGAAQGQAALNSVGQERMTTLRQDSTTQSLRLVRIADDLSQRRALRIKADRETGTLSPDVTPSYQRDAAPGASGRMVSLTVNRDDINVLRERTYAWTGTVQGGPSQEEIGDATLIRSADGSVTGTLRLGQEFFLVRPLSGELHALVGVDESKYPRGEGNGFRHDGGASGKGAPSTSRCTLYFNVDLARDFPSVSIGRSKPNMFSLG